MSWRDVGFVQFWNNSRIFYWCCIAAGWEFDEEIEGIEIFLTIIFHLIPIPHPLPALKDIVCEIKCKCAAQGEKITDRTFIESISKYTLKLQLFIHFFTVLYKNVCVLAFVWVQLLVSLIGLYVWLFFDVNYFIFPYFKLVNCNSISIYSIYFYFELRFALLYLPVHITFCQIWATTFLISKSLKSPESWWFTLSKIL